ncbi:MAG: hypothetical protein JWP81_4039 [Ferruginibacter sp.]|nr:hypothetical protein [Ferruginibacter sp.]
MKTINSILSTAIVTVICAWLTTGCTKKLEEDPRANLTPGSYFTSQTDLDAAVAGMYVAIARDGSWGFTSKMTSYFGSDDLTTDPALNKGDMREFDRLVGSSSNGSLPNQWVGPWVGIYNANNIIANYSKVPALDPASIAAKNESAGNAYFIRALSYYYLVRTFGPVPIVLTPVEEVSTSYPRSSVDSVYQAIISDLQKAKTMLTTTKKQGKPNVYAVSAILSDVYLTMAGWPLNKTANYALAAAEADFVIQNGRYDTNTPYDKVFSTNNCSESIFALQYSVGGNLPNRSFGSTSIPLEELALNGNSGWDDFYPEINFFKAAPVCTRTDLTFHTTIKIRNADKVTYTLVPWNSPATHAQHPYYEKFRAGLNGDGVNETANTIIDMQPSTNKETIIIRYPQVLLNYAEASAMAGGGPTTQGYAAINQVRARAGEAPLTPALGQIAFRDAVVFERAYECAGEFGVRWFDIVRLQLLPQVSASRDATENPIPAGTDFSKKYLAPIPLSEFSVNPSWTQNPGY